MGRVQEDEGFRLRDAYGGQIRVQGSGWTFNVRC